MIKFKSARWRNFLSSGNQDTVIKLDEAATTLILGVNGSGKCLFGNTKIVVCFDKDTEIKFNEFLLKDTLP